MIGDAVVIDAVVHGYHSPLESFTHPVAAITAAALYDGYHRAYSPRGRPEWILDRHRFDRADPELLGHALFAESRTDYDGVGETVRMDDVEAVCPILEHAQKRGIRSVAVHKAVAMPGCPIQPFHPRDLEDALIAFPDLTFQIVHGGYAFLEETALQLSYYRNATVVLEGATAFLVNAPRKFAEILGAFLAAGAAGRILWGTGCTALHPRPLIEAFRDFEMPEDLVEGYGYPPVTEALKRATLERTRA